MFSCVFVWSRGSTARRDRGSIIQEMICICRFYLNLDETCFNSDVPLSYLCSVLNLHITENMKTMWTEFVGFLI